METQKNKIISELVAKDYRLASVFKKYGLDFCCQGNRTIDDACAAKKIDSDTVVNDLNSIGTANNVSSIDYQSWPLDLLADYIEKTHHRYVVDKSPEIISYVNKVCEAHGKKNPEIYQIKDLFEKTIENLAQHMKKEELLLFPFIRKMEEAKRSGELLQKPPFDSLESQINEMEDEHMSEGDRLREIERLSNNYTPPEDACNTFRVTYTLLKEFENDLHLHIHLENNILFPKSIQMEEQLMLKQ